MREGSKAPTLFLLYINDLPDDVTSDIAIQPDTTHYFNCDQAPDPLVAFHLFADDTSLFCAIKNINQLKNKIHTSLDHIEK